MNNKAKILTINTMYDRGGAANIAATLHRHLNASPNYESIFLQGRGKSDSQQRMIKISSNFETYVHALITRMTGLQGYGSFLATRRFRQVLQQTSAHLIHLHNAHGYFVNWSFFHLMKRSGLPVLWTLHDAWPLSGRCASSLDCERWKTGCGRCPYKKNYPETYVDTSAFMWAKKRQVLGEHWHPLIITPSQWLANKVKASYLQHCDIQVIPNGVDTELFAPQDRDHLRQAMGIAAESRVIVVCAHKPTERIKGLTYFTQALERIHTPQVVVLIIGDLSHPLTVQNPHVSIHNCGYVQDKKRLAEFYSLGDLYCISSLEDNFPTTVLEAMACGLPVAGFAVGGIPEQVQEDCGVLVPKGDIAGLAQAIDGLLGDDNRRRAYAARSRQQAVTRFSTDAMFRQYIAAYQQKIQASPGVAYRP